MNRLDTVWTSLIIVGFISCFSTGLGLLLYRTSSAIVHKKGIRLTGATAIAWIFFLGMSKLYLSVSMDLQKQVNTVNQNQRDKINSAANDLRSCLRDYDDCALQTGEFPCKAPADTLRKSSQSLLLLLH